MSPQTPHTARTQHGQQPPPVDPASGQPDGRTGQQDSAASPRDQLEYLIQTFTNWFDDEPGPAVDAILVAGWRPPARVITTSAELCDLPDGTLVHARDARLYVHESDSNGWLGAVGGDWTYHTDMPMPVTVLHVPTEEGSDE